MLYSFLGTDTIKIRESAFVFLKKQEGEKEPRIITGETFYPGIIHELSESVSLFGGSEVILFDTISDSEFFEDFLHELSLLTASKNTFILIEGGCTASEKKKIEKASEKVTEINSEKSEKFNTFALTDALVSRDKKKFWLLLNEAWGEGVSNEEIIGVLLWQIKVMRLVAKTSSPDEAGQKPFVYQKAKRALALFKEGELDRMSRDLISIYHRGHQGVVDMPYALEAWVLQW